MWRDWRRAAVSCLSVDLSVLISYSPSTLSRSSIGYRLYTLLFCCLSLFPLFACLPAWWRCFNARLPSHHHYSARGHNTLTQAKAIAADTSRQQTLVVYSVPSHTYVLTICSTCQHMSASLSTPSPMLSPRSNTHSDPPASLRGCSNRMHGWRGR
jgi:hypothetical protein